MDAYNKVDIDKLLPKGYSCQEVINDNNLYIQIKCPNGESKGYGIEPELRKRPLKEIVDYVITKIKDD